MGIGVCRVKNPRFSRNVVEVLVYHPLAKIACYVSITLPKENVVRIRLAALLVFGIIAVSWVASGQGPRPGDLGASQLDLGEAGIHWYTTWDTAQAEAERSGRPIMFVAAATQCHGVSGVF